MVEVIFPDIHRIEVPVHGNPLNAVNSYVIKGGNRNLIIDMGLNRAVSVTVQTLYALIVSVLTRTDS